MKNSKFNFFHLLTLTVLVLTGANCGGGGLEVGQEFTLSASGTLQVTQEVNGGALKSGVIQELVPITGTLLIKIIQDLENAVEVEAVELRAEGTAEMVGDIELFLDPQMSPAENAGEISKRDQEGNPFFQSFLNLHPGLTSTAGVQCGGTFILVSGEDSNTLKITAGVALDCMGNDLVVVQDMEVGLPPDFIEKLEKSD